MPRKPLAVALAAGLAGGAVAAEPPQHSLTVYSGAAPGSLSVATLASYGGGLPGYALVRDHRRLPIARGRGELRFTDVARRIDPTTVSFASRTDPAGTRVLEQNFQFDLVDQQKLIERFIGARIAVLQQRGDQLARIEGTLLSASGGLILARDGGEVVTLGQWQSVEFPNLPGGLITRPTLVWTIDAARGGEHDVQVGYQTQGMTWWSDYNLTLSGGADDCRMDLAAWVTVVNQSGGSYRDAQLKLVAGEVNRAPAAAAPRAALRAAMPVMTAEADAFEESELFEYHLYTLGRRTDLPDNSIKQLELFPAALGVPCKRELVFTASPTPWTYWGAPIVDQGYGATQQGTVGAFLEFDNKEAGGLGIPLPAGRIRVNQASPTDGSLEFIGEDLIRHTPRNETVRVKLGNAFDVVGERRQIDFRYDEAGKFIEETFELSIRNRKREPARVTAREYLYRWSKWTIVRASHPHEKRDAATMDFPLTIAADGEAKVTYTVRYSW